MYPNHSHNPYNPILPSPKRNVQLATLLPHCDVHQPPPYKLIPPLLGTKHITLTLNYLPTLTLTLPPPLTLTLTLTLTIALTPTTLSYHC